MIQPLHARLRLGIASAAVAPVDIRDIRGPESIASIWPWIFGLCAVAVIGAAAWIFWRWRSHRLHRSETLLPYQHALRQLEALHAHMQSETSRGFSIAICDIVRGYIEAQFQLMALHLTTEEFFQSLREAPQRAVAGHRVLLEDFLAQCDLAKFGGWNLSSRDMERMHASARAFVQQTGQRTESAGESPGREQHVSVPST